MNKSMVALILAGIVNFSPVSCYAEEPMPLELEGITYLALKNNHAIEQSAEDQEYAKWALSKARRQGGPVLSYSFDGGRGGSSSYGRPMVDGNDFNHAARLSMPLYHGGQLSNQRREKEFALNAADLTLENTRQAVKLKAASAYYEVLRCKEMVAVRQEEVRLLDEHLRLATIKYHEGVLPKLDILSSNVSLADAQQNLVTAQGEYEKAIASLNNVVCMPEDTQWHVDSELGYEKLEVSLEDCKAFALENRPDYYAAAYTVKQAEYGVKEARAGYLPQVDATVSRSIEGDKAFSSDTSRSWKAGVSVGWNVFDSGVTSADIHQAQAQLKKAKSAEAQARDDVLLEVNNAYINLKKAEENIRTTEIAAAQAREEYTLAQICYEEGVGTNLAVMDAQEKLTRARTNHSTALYNYNAARAALEKAVGVPVDISVPRYVTAVTSGSKPGKALESAALSPEEENGWEQLTDK